MEEFVKREGGPNGRVPVPEAMRENVTHSASICNKMAKSKFEGEVPTFTRGCLTLFRPFLSRQIVLWSRCGVFE
jgi:hypothetical protein